MKHRPKHKVTNKKGEEPTPADRAIDVAKPRRAPERWRREFASYVAMLERARFEPQVSPADKRDRLQQVASALAKAEKILSRLPRGYSAFRDEVKRVGETAKRYAGRVKVSHSGGRRDRDAHIKEYAATFAFDLLNDYGRSPTQATAGNYFHLASILFEVATGRAHVSIMRQCRQHITLMRKEIDNPNAFRIIRRKRSGPS